MRKFFGKQKAKRNISALVAAGIIIVGGYMLRRFMNKVKIKNIEDSLLVS